MYCYYDELRFIYNSIYESLTKDAKATSTQYWKLVLRKLNPHHYVLSAGSSVCVCTLAYLDGYFCRANLCDPMSLLKDARPCENVEWRNYVTCTIADFAMYQKRDLLRLLTESPVYGVFVRNQLARE